MRLQRDHRREELAPVSPEYVLAVIIDEHRQSSQLDPEVDESVDLKFNTTVAEWRYACDLIPAKALGRVLNEQWSIKCSDREWREVLEPPETKTLWDVCTLIAGHATRPRLSPTRLLASNCSSTAVFREIQHALKEAGCRDAYAIRPSTPLDEYLREYMDVFLGSVSRLGPGRLPLVHVENQPRTAIFYTFVLAGLMMLVGTGMQWAGLTVFGALLCLVCLLLLLALSGMKPSRVEFGQLRTFRDLVIALTDDAGPETRQPLER